jgi:hypothetical protein
MARDEMDMRLLVVVLAAVSVAEEGDIRAAERLHGSGPASWAVCDRDGGCDEGTSQLQTTTLRCQSRHSRCRDATSDGRSHPSLSLAAGVA